MNEEHKNYTFNGTTYTYTDAKSNKTYTWDLEKNIWIELSEIDTQSKGSKDKEHSNAIKENEEENDSDEDTEKLQTKTQDMSQGIYGYEGDTRTYTDTRDGTVYFWDKEKNAWFPKIDDTFIAQYQLNYGLNATNITAANVGTELKSEQLKETKKVEKVENIDENRVEKRKLPPEPPKWFEMDDQHNTKVYVSNLPLDITESEFVDLMQKCGLVMKDLDSGKMKVKLYTDPISKELKGDALCTYIKKESVDLALQLLDGYDVRGRKIKIERARFTMKGDAYDPNLKPKKRRKKDKEKMKKIQERLFAWQPDKLRGERAKHERVVVIKNLFDPTLFDENLGLVLEYQQDIREECSKCGSVKKVVVYDKHKDGVAQVWFKEAEAADACVQLLNNRWFSQRLLTAETWDGKTRYKVQETPEETELRLKKWEEYLNTNRNTKKDEVGNENLINQQESVEECDSDATRSSAGSEDETDDETNIKQPT